MKHKERLDVLLVARGLAESRQPGRQAVIMAGEVYVNGQKADQGWAWMSRLKPRSRCAGTCARM